ncbi:MAG: hypothetical protein H6Q14_2799 [Bacteroidetes bacterium]|nr:hypothetical protein [Bacteroidota bacterium]
MDRFMRQTVKKTVVILDSSPIDKSKKFMDKIEEWKEKDVLIFFLPPYSPKLNLIEILWESSINGYLLTPISVFRISKKAYRMY